ncbi:MAG TPA: glutamine amidotransferase [Candidatus Acidoferrales bacterium]|nr:glutamine amidotransferase [Candidatus Acidoferrales bacterium]
MFEFLFKYPRAVFAKGTLVLLGAWPWWVFVVLVLAAGGGLAWLIRSRIPQASAQVKNWKAGVLWLLQFALAALVLLLLWQPALLVAELRPQQNIIAVVVDDSRSMAIADSGGATREQQAVKALEGGVLDQLQKKFQVRVYRLDRQISRMPKLDDLKTSPPAPATRIGDGLKQLAGEAADLPIGAVVLLSDGADNSGGIDLDTISTFRSRRIPVHTVGFGAEQVARDVEINDAVVAPRALADSRLAAKVTLHQRGYAGQKAMLTVRAGGKVLAGRQITLAADGATQNESLLFNPGDAGAKTLQFSVDPLPGEENHDNNSVSRLVNVESAKRRVLYVEGEPRWEYKFIRRAEQDDRLLTIVSMLRTSENKIYRQGIDDPKELADGFPSRGEDLFPYQAIIIGSVEANYFTAAQKELLQQFVDRRGGGLLFLGGRAALGDGGWAASSLADVLPVTLPNRKGTFHRDPATVSLTAAGADNIITRLVEDPAANVERWKKLPYLMDYQEAGTPKPGAVVLAEMTAAGRKMPMLITENYGRGRTAVLATGGTWRWQMSQPLEDQTHEEFWQQLLRWLVTDTPGRVAATVPNQMLLDDGRVQFTADVRDKNFLPAADAHVEAHILGPGGSAAQIEMTPDPNTPGTFHADWTADQQGSYLTEVVATRDKDELGRDVLNFARMDGVAENFHTEQNRDLLEKLSAETGGRYWKPQDVSRLPSEISYSEAGITVRDTKELWNMPIVFLLLLLLPSTEWLLRRKWGVV